MRAYSVICLAKASSVPPIPSARMMAASLPDWTVMPWIRSPIAHHGVERREHGRPAGRRAPGPPGMLAHLELILELEPPRFQLAEHDGKRHQLAHAGRRRQRVGILLEQHEIGVGIHEDGVLGLGLEGAWRGAARAGAAATSRRRARARRLTAAILIHLSRREAYTGRPSLIEWNITAAALRPTSGEYQAVLAKNQPGSRKRAS